MDMEVDPTAHTLELDVDQEEDDTDMEIIQNSNQFVFQ